VNEIGQAINLLDGAQYAGGKNRVLNSNFSVFQRGTSFTGTFATGTGTYTADRWLAYIGAGANTISRQVTGDTTNLPFIQYCLRVARDSGQTGTNTVYLANGFESVNSIPLAGKTVVLSFYARAGANYSSASNALLANVITGTGTDQNVISGLTGGVNAISQTATLTTTWQRFTYSATLAATATQVAVRFDRTPVGTAGANDYYEITGVQLEVANTASPYAPNCPTFATELAACQRYFYLSASGTSKPIGNGNNNSATLMRAVIPFPVTMRTTPTVGTTGTASDYLIRFTGSTANLNAVPSLETATEQQIRLACNVASGLTAGQGIALIGANSTIYLSYSAEL
jgi:hypothetical protein